MKIFLDAGHGGTDPGATGGGVKEKDWTLDIDNRIAELAKEQGFDVLRTRTTDATVEPNIRATKIKNSRAKYCISSHINAGGGEGAETIHSIHNNGKLAQAILDELGKIGLNKRRAYTRKQSNGQDYYYMHRLTGNVTTIIVEYGFIDNANDRAFLAKADNRQKCAEAVVKAICKVGGKTYKKGNQGVIYFAMGHKGGGVKKLQQDLIKLGFPLGKHGADGSFGPDTQTAVIAFQNHYKLKVDGSAGPETLAKIKELLDKKEQPKPKQELHRVKIDGKQVGAYKEVENITQQIEKNIKNAKEIKIQKV